MTLAVSLLSSQPRYRSFVRTAVLPNEVGYLWQIVSGIVRAYTWQADGTLITLGLYGPGDLVGRTFFAADPYAMKCLTPVAVVRRPQEQLSELTGALLANLRQSTQLLQIVQCRRAQDSLVQMLTWLGQRFGRRVEQGISIDLPLTHQDLAELVGTTRVTITKSLSDLERQGAIHRSLTRRRIIILTQTTSLDIQKSWPS